MKFLIFLTLPLAAQISSPQLGYTSHRGELRRIEGLAHSSRLSDPVAGLPACSRLDAGSRYAFCTQPDGVKLIDLQTLTATQTVDAYQRIVWSPNGTKAALDSQLLDLATMKSTRVADEIVAISDTGSIAVRDAQGALRLRGEVVAGPESATAAFDGEALLIATGFSVRRIDPGHSSQQYPLAFEPSFVAADAGAFYAASSRAIARIDRATGEVTVHEVPAEDIVITRLERLNGEALLVANPGEKQPGWLFRDGRFSFIPGFPKEEEVAQ